MSRKRVLDSPIPRNAGQPRRSQLTDSPEAALLGFLHRNGYVRTANEKKRKELGQKYKKGYEVRLVARSQSELAQIRELLKQVGFKAGRPFGKHKQLVQPIYGKRAVEWFTKRNLH